MKIRDAQAKLAAMIGMSPRLLWVLIATHLLTLALGAWLGARWVSLP